MKLISVLLLLLTFNSFSQNEDEYWKKWNSNYKEIDILRVLKYEQYYADSVECHPKIPPYYGRSAKYRFQAENLGQVRPLDKSIMISMRNTFKLFVGNPAQLDSTIDSEILMKVGENRIWMPIQKQLLNPLRNEISVGDTLTLYCLYLNEHSEKNGLRNIFVISEFYK